jgi:hypothetical protein
MSDGTSNQGPLKCSVCGWPLVRHLTPCPEPEPELPFDNEAFDCFMDGGLRVVGEMVREHKPRSPGTPCS